MGKKIFIFLLIVLLLPTCFWLCTKCLSTSGDLPHKSDLAKKEFIAFPTKENESKVSPSTKELPESIPKNKTDGNKEKSTEKKVIEKEVQVSSPDTILRLGDSGDRVKYIQHRLNEYGYKVKTDGLFKSLTYDAILNFQYRCKLTIDGAVGAKTLGKLNMPVTKNIEFNTKKPAFSGKVASKNYKSASELEAAINSSSATSSTNYYISVNLRNQRVNIFKGSKGKWVLDKSFLCSSGKASTPTVKGNFTIKDKGPMFRAGSNTICNYYTRFYGGYLFHTVLLDNNGNIQDGRLGTPLSHGCIRLAINNAKYIYTTIPYGTSVSIQ
jgi:lipoprotein-anchoring transpeptidase ErfK/SrfK